MNMRSTQGCQKKLQLKQKGRILEMNSMLLMSF